MQYPGSKERIAGAILFYILKNRNGAPYIEPFMGGANVMSRVETGKRCGNDINFYLIQMWQALQEGWIPPEFVSEHMYVQVKNNKWKYDPALVGYVGFVCSFNSFWFSSYRGIVTRARIDNQGNRIKENQQHYARNHLMKQVHNMVGVLLSNGQYIDMSVPNGSIVYCDPPYKDVSMPYIEQSFDSDQFWNWVKDVAKHSLIFVTEYTAPEDFVAIWTETIRPIGGTLYGSMHPNKLFVHRSQVGAIDTEPPFIPKLVIPNGVA